MAVPKAKADRWLYLPLEIKVRDLRGKILLACVAAKEGFNVILGYKTKLEALSRYLPPGIFFGIGLHKNFADAAKKNKEAGHITAAFDEEGLVTLNDLYYKSFRVSKETLSRTDMLFAWGQRQADLVREVAKETACVVQITGHPRFDLLRPEFREVYSNDVNLLKQKYGSFILINTSFGGINHFRGANFGYQESLRRYRMNPLEGFDPELRLGLRNRIFEKFVEVMAILSKHFEKRRFIIRPHPSENHEYWSDVTNSLPNVQVIHEGEVIPWLMAADLVVQNECTTAVEAFLLGTPTIAYRPVKNDKLETILTNSLSHQVFNAEELVECMQALLENPREFYQREKGMKETAKFYIEGMQGPLASERIVEVLLDLEVKDSKSEYLFRKSFAISKMVNKIYGIRSHVLSSIRRNQGTTYAEHKFPGFEMSEIKTIINEFRSVTGLFEGITPYSFGKKCFFLKSQMPSR